jgi:DNA-binding transcriptional LysR family regulator
MGAFGKTLNEIKQSYPDLEIKLIAGLSSNFLDQVIEGTIDGAIVTESPYALPQNVQWTELYKEPMILIAPSALKSSKNSNILNDQLPFIRFERNTWTGNLVEQTIRVNKLKIQDGMELNSVEAIIELVRQGLGYSIVPQLANISWSSDRQLKIQKLPGKTVYRKVGLLERKKHSRNNITGAIKGHFLSNVLKTS